MDFMETRYELSMDRIREIPGEKAVSPEFTDYFEKGAEWFILMDEEMRFLSSEEVRKTSISSLKDRNRRLYEEILPGNYSTSYANFEYAAATLGEEIGPFMAALRYEIRSAVPFAYRLERARVLIRAELFLEVYTAFTIAWREDHGTPDAEQIRSILRQYLIDYAEEEMEYSIADNMITGSERIRELVLDEQGGIRNLYLTGEYVTDNETESALYMASLPEEKIRMIAETITEGYRRGFINCGKNMASKKNAEMIFHLGFERIIRECMKNLSRLGLHSIIPSEIPTLFHDFYQGMMGYSGADPNPQYYYDHKEDLALFLDEKLRAKRLEGIEKAFKKLKKQTVFSAGPVVIETFGIRPFTPVSSPCVPRYSKVQQRMCTEYRIKKDNLSSEAEASKDSSFTIIDFPLPVIADNKGIKNEALYKEIFDAVLAINTLDNDQFAKIQQKMIDVLGTAVRVEVKGRNGNRTDLTVQLFVPEDPAAEANFENCTADVNIPVGEVFTTPVLEGTNGTLHVTGVYLEGLYYKDLEITFQNGRVKEYRCGNFEDDEEGKRYIEENILFHHKDLPLGELAIGTNTTAYAAAARYGIADRLPILIAEKTGPHFAVGDTCYSRDEDNRMYNPDGKEIVAKENSVSALRKTDPEKAYFGCHTDITIPYEELGEFTAVKANGERIPILLNSRFVLEGTQILNEPLDEMALN